MSALEGDAMSRNGVSFGSPHFLLGTTGVWIPSACLQILTDIRKEVKIPRDILGKITYPFTHNNIDVPPLMNSEYAQNLREKFQKESKKI